MPPLAEAATAGAAPASGSVSPGVRGCLFSCFLGRGGGRGNGEPLRRRGKGSPGGGNWEGAVLLAPLRLRALVGAGGGAAAWLLHVGAGAVGTEGPGPGPLGTGCGNVFRSAQLSICYAWNKPDLAVFIATIPLFSPNSWKTPPPSPVASAKPWGLPVAPLSLTFHSHLILWILLPTHDVSGVVLDSSLQYPLPVSAVVFLLGPQFICSFNRTLTLLPKVF